MRHQLAFLEGQTVIFVGRAKEHKRHGTRVNLLLTNVRLWRTSDDLALETAKPDARVEHLWVSSHESGFQRAEMFTERSGAGTVGLYARANGSIDYGVRMVESIYLDAFNDSLWESKDAAEASAQIGGLLLEREENPDAIFYGFRKSPSQWFKHLQRVHTQGLRSACAGLARSLMATRNGPCTGLKKAFAPKRRQLKTARGFA